MNQEQVLAYAVELAGRLRKGINWHSDEYGEYWTAAEPSEMHTIVAPATEARECFRLYAGADSQWTPPGRRTLQNEGWRQVAGDGRSRLG